MAGGLPGVGLGGVFFVAAGLLLPVVETVRVLRGQSQGGRWLWVLRRFLISAAILAVVTFTFVSLGAAFESEVVLDDSAAAGTQPEPSSAVGAISLRTLVVIMALVLTVPALHRILASRDTSVHSNRSGR